MAAANVSKQKWLTLLKELATRVEGRSKETPVEGPLDFTHDFDEHVEHFYVPGTLGDVYQHHFLVKRRYYKEQECIVNMIHYAAPEKKTEDGAQSDCFVKTREWIDKAKKQEQVTQVKSVVRRNSFSFKVKDNEATFNSDNAAKNVYYDLLVAKKWVHVTSDLYPTTELNMIKAWQSAGERINETKYNAFTHNCEHFVTEIMAGKGVSKQVDLHILNAARSSVACFS